MAFTAWLFTSCNTMNKNTNTKNMRIYPIVERGKVVDNYFGTKVPDPYRWLEDDNSKQTKIWVDAENKFTASYLDRIPFRAAMKKRLEKLWNYPKESTPFKKGKYWYYYKNNGLQAQSVLYQMNDLNSKATVFIDPNKFSKDGTVALSVLSFSKDGKFCAYSISKGGSDWNEIYVMDVDKKLLLNDTIKWVKFSGINWYKNGFYYGRFPMPEKGNALKGKNLHQMVYFHKIGTPQSDDILAYKDDAHPDRMYSIYATKDETFLILSGEDPAYRGNMLSYKKADAKQWISVQADYNSQLSVIGNIGETLYFQTNNNAPNGKVFRINSNDKSQTHISTIAETTDVLQGTSIKGDYLFAEYLHDASSLAIIYNADGSKKQEVKLPGLGSISGFSGDDKTLTLFYSFTSFTVPNLSYKYDIKTNKSTLYHKSALDFNMNDYETKQVFYPSKDGTMIPMFIVYKKGIVLNGHNPTMLYGYGGFDISLPPNFSVDRLLWLEQGGIYAQANLRGGGEYGEKWHEAGTKLNKQNVFDDFIAAAKYLIQNSYTSPQYLAISGRSNGGLLVGATMTQRPDLMHVAFPGVGVLDMLRYHKFTIGYYWADDYGTSDDSIQFENLIRYSPLHNLHQGQCYPSTLIVTADHDDRVFPAHSFKFAAELQHDQGCNKPCLIRIDKNAGHGAGKPTEMVIQDKVDMWSFAFYEMGLRPNY